MYIGRYSKLAQSGIFEIEIHITRYHSSTLPLYVQIHLTFNHLQYRHHSTPISAPAVAEEAQMQPLVP